jgi:hypothetical protein
MFKIVVLLACSAIIASASPAGKADQLALSHAEPSDHVMEPSDDETAPSNHHTEQSDHQTELNAIHAILENLYVSSETSSEYDESAPAKAVIKAVRKFVESHALPCFVYRYAGLRPISDFCLQALGYAHSYSMELNKEDQPQVVVDPSNHLDHPLPDLLPSWNPESFRQRLQNFGWEHLPAREQDYNMAATLVELMQLVELVWGGRDELKEAEQRLSHDHHYPTTAASIKSHLEKEINKMVVRQIREILGKLILDSEPSEHGSLNPANAPPEEVIKAVRKFGRTYAQSCRVYRYAVLRPI